MRKFRGTAALSACWLACLAGLACGGGEGASSNEDVPIFCSDEVAGKPCGPRPHFSFFVTTQQGLFSLPAGRYSPAPDPVLGFGGDLGGLGPFFCELLFQLADPQLRLLQSGANREQLVFQDPVTLGEADEPVARIL